MSIPQSEGFFSNFLEHDQLRFAAGLVNSASLSATLLDALHVIAPRPIFVVVNGTIPRPTGTPAAEAQARVALRDSLTITELPLPATNPAAPATAATPPVTEPTRPFGDGAVRPGNGITAPEPIARPTPLYTAEGMRQSLQGAIQIEAVVLPTGQVGDVRIVKALDNGQYGLDQNALDAARHWEFRPGRDRNGNAVPVIVTLIFDMRLHGGAIWGPLEVVSPPAGTLSLPTRVNKGVPSYPDTARRDGTEATIVVETNTDATGKVVSARVIEGQSFFDDLVQAVAERWTFTPTMLDGVAVPTTVTTTIRFVLRK